MSLSPCSYPNPSGSLLLLVLVLAVGLGVFWGFPVVLELKELCVIACQVCGFLSIPVCPSHGSEAVTNTCGKSCDGESFPPSPSDRGPLLILAEEPKFKSVPTSSPEVT